MNACMHAHYCQRRLRDGDQGEGCTAADLSKCTPILPHFAPVRAVASEKPLTRWNLEFFNPAEMRP